MALYGTGLEYALHCLLPFVDRDREGCISARDVAEFQGVSPSYVAKIFTLLEKAGIVSAAEGIAGGYMLSKDPAAISVLNVADAAEGRKPLFKCKNIKTDCILFDGNPPGWAARGRCSIHAVMLEAEDKLREQLAAVTLADISARVASKAPSRFFDQSRDWFDQKTRARRRPISSTGRNT